ncbi:MAG: 50S ribosomal protein L14 [Candidatus Staskawiczbacteria bacterium RIFCSPHIGHO2_02_FULL_43_16]|uniref:Large ribosomal subunit protein uL14 n=1 Tax=Candidatus Staskawiczbacteria bacterium RIFCSPHIGHO2_01_FULL_41_41 TaxID=1802203 RepID=A0A1G2HSQ7_9BACT|nr:MAG: 50S ribosomal protein L14 [Candidatus Staskawiczbacteria bacterium RIFCSPHIGHO2_01_FULL_41_41]OGZ68265.1 MAG: 50S ribosomal protein L14 [Candidatus Staskawiczbacteria bacterium RIFCSPHIGHO2_02_FULL_43_16]OGZ74654.1 MAG: 50S ribosomal protein L14 [Candidatus Staskawiczbacteria bacterium RIFCSPLOWO2_01_FULL_43_17b]
MIQLRSMVTVADNSGAKIIQCVNVPGGSGRRYAQIGDVIVGTVKKAEPRKLVKKHEVVKAVIIRQRKEFKRADGSYIRFDDNAVVVLGEGKLPKGGRVFGPAAKELKDKGFDKIAMMAFELL